MSINLDEWDDYALSLKFVNTAKMYASEGSWFGLSKKPSKLVIAGVEMRVDNGHIVPEDIDYIKSIVGLNPNLKDVH